MKKIKTKTKITTIVSMLIIAAAVGFCSCSASDDDSSNAADNTASSISTVSASPQVTDSVPFDLGYCLYYQGVRYSPNDMEYICNRLYAGDFDESVTEGMTYLGETEKINATNANELTEDLQASLIAGKSKVYLADESGLGDPNATHIFLIVQHEEQLNEVTAFYYP